MSEVRMWETLRDKAKAHPSLGGIERITEKLNPGVPDTVYVFKDGDAGWLELKVLDSPGKRWPLVRIPWKSVDQPFWLQRWVRWGGRAGVLLKVEEVGWFYWRPSTEIKWIAWVQAPVAIDSATWACGPQLDVDGLLTALH